MEQGQVACRMCAVALVPVGGVQGEGVCLRCFEELEAMPVPMEAMERGAREFEEIVNAILATMEREYLEREEAARNGGA